jgi:pimeloyl-[acyl-carrier protein] methyl ester esterase
LPCIRMPVMYLRANEDQVIARAASETIARHIPDIRMEAFDAPHALLQTMPDETAVVIKQFMADCDSGRKAVRADGGTHAKKRQDRNNEYTS